MRIAYFCGGPAADYVEDLLLGGLVAILGLDAVRWSAPPAADGSVGKGHLRHRLSSARPAKVPERVCWTPGTADCATDDGGDECDLVDLAREADLVVIGKPTDPARAAFYTDMIEGLPHKRVVLVNGHDREEPRIQEAVLPDGPWFVREQSDDGLDDRRQSIAIPFNAVDLPAIRPWHERDISLLWVGASHFGRVPWIEAARSIHGAHVQTDPISHADYLALMARSRMCLVLSGAGTQTYRAVEAAAFGCATVVHRDIGVCNDHAEVLNILAAGPDDLGRALTSKLADDCAYFGQANRTQLLMNLTHTAVAARFLSEAERCV